jgi:environmental stress-induced protein Ves
MFGGRGSREIKRASWRPEPWKNGRGTTYEVFREPPRARTLSGIERTRDVAMYDLRVSVARVEESSPFSEFVGYRRFTFLLGPAPIRLAQATTTFDLVTVGDHVSMPGEEPIEATLRAGPTSLLNVLLRTELTASVVVGSGPTSKPIHIVFDLASTDAVFYATATQRNTHGCVWIA